MNLKIGDKVRLKMSDNLIVDGTEGVITAVNETQSKFKVKGRAYWYDVNDIEGIKGEDGDAESIFKPTAEGCFKEITDKMCDTFVRKNHDYGNSFDISMDKFGMVAAVCRIGDKMNRVESLIDSDAMVKDESLRDTLLDMANYCIMTVMWMDKKK